MRKLWMPAVVCAVIVFAAVVGASAQEMKVAVMDLSTVMSESEAGKIANAELAAFAQAKQAEIDQLNEQVDALQAELGEEGELSEDERAAKQAELDDLIDQLQQQATQAQAEINQKTQQLRNRVLNEIGQVLNIIGRERDYTLILDSSAVFYYKLVVDITWEVVRRYDELYQPPTQESGESSSEAPAETPQSSD